LVITIASQKGGSGKTTLTTSLADALASDGERVLVIDADPQRTALAWSASTPSDAAAPTTLAADALALSPRHLAPLVSAYAWVIIDTAPRVGEATLAALRAADLVLVPVRPSPFDLSALPAILDAAAGIRAPLRAVITQRPPRSTTADSAPEAIRASGLVPLTGAMCLRADYIDAASQGRGAVSASPKSKAAAEVLAILAEVRALLSPSPAPTQRRGHR